MKKIKLIFIAPALAASLAACAPTPEGNVNRAGGSNNANTVAPLSSDNAALLAAARGGNADTVKTLLVVPGININAQDEAGNTPLILAARFGHDDTVKQLLIGGADVKIRNNNGTSALSLAAKGGHTQTVELLRQAGAAE